MYLPYCVIIDISAYFPLVLHPQLNTFITLNIVYLCKDIIFKTNIMFFSQGSWENFHNILTPIWFQECHLFATQLFNYIKHNNHKRKTGHCIIIPFSTSCFPASPVHLSFLTNITTVQFEMFFFVYSFYFIITPIFTKLNQNVINSEIICWLQSRIYKYKICI